jgi:hypothetical protein
MVTPDRRPVCPGGTRPQGDAMLGFGDDLPTLLTLEEVIALPPMEWQVDRIILGGSLVVLTGTNEAETTQCALDISLSLVHASPFAGLEVQPGSVLYLAGEGHHGMTARVQAWMRHHSHLGLDKGDRHCLISREIPTLSARTMPSLGKLVAEVAEEMGHPPSLIVIDTLAHGIKGDVNNPSVLMPGVRGLRDIQNRWRCTTLVTADLVPPGRICQRTAVRPIGEWVVGEVPLSRCADTVLGLIPECGMPTLEVWKQRDAHKLSVPIPLPAVKRECRRGS